MKPGDFIQHQIPEVPFKFGITGHRCWGYLLRPVTTDMFTLTGKKRSLSASFWRLLWVLTVGLVEHY